MGDGDHFGADGDWSEDKERRLRDGITGIAKVVLDAHDTALRARVAELEGEVGRLTVQLAGCLVAAEGATSGDAVAHEGDYGWSVAYQATLDVRRQLDAALARATAAVITIGAGARGAALEEEVERLRRDLAAVVRERDEARESVKVGLPLLHEATERAEKAENERDIAEAAWRTLNGSMNDLAQSARENERRAEAAEAREAGLREALTELLSAYEGDDLYNDRICDAARAALAATAKEAKP